jgi:transcriptional regulator with GAF, ATPase, and Fis domain
LETVQQLLLSVWQEACRHIDISRSTSKIVSLLGQHIPVEQVLVRQIDAIRPCLDTVAVGLAGREHGLPDARTDCSVAELQSLLAWCRQKKVAHRRGNPGISEELATLVFGRFDGDVLAGPLGDPEAHCGLLVFLPPAGRVFQEQHAALAQLLLEPFSAALENDLRLREMAALSEAAEADKRSLLTRLGRKTLGDTIVGVESGLRAVMERVELVARSDAPVLIFGETGTGKELVARAIHNRSARHQGPFDRVNCGAIPAELIDSQLFGHERGAFTGAVEARRGWFERAHGGTLFLDEIGELPLAAQVRMLRILQDGWMERVGGEKAIHVDVRIIAATHRDLAAMVAEGRFREDLWYRIAVFPIVLPPLRERREDIAQLARHFAQRAATRFGLAPAVPTPEDLALLTSYPWPGNVRELGTVIDRAAILGDGKRLEVAKALGIGAESSGKPLEIERPRPASRPPSGPIEPLNAVVRQHIEAALAVARGRIEGRQGAAALLEINPHTLRAKMRKLGIDWASFREGP